MAFILLDYFQKQGLRVLESSLRGIEGKQCVLRHQRHELPPVRCPARANAAVAFRALWGPVPSLGRALPIPSRRSVRPERWNGGPPGGHHPAHPGPRPQVFRPGKRGSWKPGHSNLRNPYPRRRVIPHGKAFPWPFRWEYLLPFRWPAGDVTSSASRRGHFSTRDRSPGRTTGREQLGPPPLPRVGPRAVGIDLGTTYSADRLRGRPGPAVQHPQRGRRPAHAQRGPLRRATARWSARKRCWPRPWSPRRSPSASSATWAPRSTARRSTASTCRRK